MRRTGALFMLALSISAGTYAQTSVEFMPTAGYTFASRTDYYDTYGRISDGLSLGASLKFNFNQYAGLEILYSHMDTHAGIYQYGYGDTKLSGSDLTFDYIMLGGVGSFGAPNSPVRPFIGGFLGAAVLTPGQESGYSSETKFAVGAQLGANFYMTPRFGLQLKAQVLAPVDVATQGIYFSNYGGGGGISTYSSITQFSLSAGLIIGLGNLLGNDSYHRTYHRPRPRPYRYYYY